MTRARFWFQASIRVSFLQPDNSLRYDMRQTWVMNGIPAKSFLLDVLVLGGKPSRPSRTEPHRIGWEQQRFPTIIYPARKSRRWRSCTTYCIPFESEYLQVVTRLPAWCLIYQPRAWTLVTLIEPPTSNLRLFFNVFLQLKFCFWQFKLESR
jgi:hypothetical protein